MADPKKVPLRKQHRVGDVLEALRSEDPAAREAASSLRKRLLAEYERDNAAGRLLPLQFRDACALARTLVTVPRWAR